MTDEKTAALDGFQDIQTMALTKAIAGKIAKLARENVEPGTHDVAFDCHVEGTITVGQDYEQKMVNKAKPWNLIAVLLEELAKTREAAGQTGIDLGKLMAAAEAMDPDMAKAAREKAEAEAAALKAATLSTAKGKVTAKLAVTPL